MKTAIVMLACRRPEYFRRSLSRVLVNDDVREMPLWLALDGPENAKDAENVSKTSEIFDAVDHPDKHKVCLKSSAGPCLPTLRTFDAAFAAGADRVIRVEDDLLLAPYALRALGILHEQLTKTHGLGAASVMHYNVDDYGTKRARLREVCHTDNVQVFICDKDLWEQIRGDLDEYQTRFLTHPGVARPYRARNNGAVRVWLRKLMDGDPGPWDVVTSHDAVIRASIRRHRAFFATTVVNHAVCIGAVGEHTRPATHKRLDEQRLDTFSRMEMQSAMMNPNVIESIW